VPEKYQKARPYPGTDTPYTMGEAAAQGDIVKVRCYGCFKTMYFLAADLAALYGEKKPALEPPPFECSKCGHAGLLRVELRMPKPGDYGNLAIRRPGPVKKIQTWRSVKLGDP